MTSEKIDKVWTCLRRFIVLTTLCFSGFLVSCGGGGGVGQILIVVIPDKPATEDPAIARAAYITGLQNGKLALSKGRNYLDPASITKMNFVLSKEAMPWRQKQDILVVPDVGSPAVVKFKVSQSNRSSIPSWVNVTVSIQNDSGANIIVQLEGNQPIGFRENLELQVQLLSAQDAVVVSAVYKVQVFSTQLLQVDWPLSSPKEFTIFHSTTGRFEIPVISSGGVWIIESTPSGWTFNRNSMGGAEVLVGNYTNSNAPNAPDERLIGKLSLISDDGQSLELVLSTQLIARRLEIVTGRVLAHYLELGAAEPIRLTGPIKANDAREYSWEIVSRPAWFRAVNISGTTGASLNYTIDREALPVFNDELKEVIVIVGRHVDGTVIRWELPVTIAFVKPKISVNSANELTRVNEQGLEKVTFAVAPLARNWALEVFGNTKFLNAQVEVVAWPKFLRKPSVESLDEGPSNLAFAMLHFRPNDLDTSSGSIEELLKLKVTVAGFVTELNLPMSYLIPDKYLVASKTAISLYSTSDLSKTTESIVLTDELGYLRGWRAQSSNSWLLVDEAGVPGAPANLRLNLPALESDRIYRGTVIFTRAGANPTSVTVPVSAFKSTNASAVPSAGIGTSVQSASMHPTEPTVYFDEGKSIVGVSLLTGLEVLRVTVPLLDGESINEYGSVRVKAKLDGSGLYVNRIRPSETDSIQSLQTLVFSFSQSNFVADNCAARYYNDFQQPGLAASLGREFFLATIGSGPRATCQGTGAYPMGHIPGSTQVNTGVHDFSENGVRAIVGSGFTFSNFRVVDTFWIWESPNFSSIRAARASSAIEKLGTVFVSDTTNLISAKISGNGKRVIYLKSNERNCMASDIETQGTQVVLPPAEGQAIGILRGSKGYSICLNDNAASGANIQVFSANLDLLSTERIGPTGASILPRSFSLSNNGQYLAVVMSDQKVYWKRIAGFVSASHSQQVR